MLVCKKMCFSPPYHTPLRLSAGNGEAGRTSLVPRARLAGCGVFNRTPPKVFWSWCLSVVRFEMETKRKATSLGGEASHPVPCSFLAF